MITLPRYTYNLLFLRTDGDQELVEHATEKDWLTRKSRRLDTVLFPA